MQTLFDLRFGCPEESRMPKHHQVLQFINSACLFFERADIAFGKSLRAGFQHAAHDLA